MALGVGGDFQSDLFAQQAGEVVITAVQTVRTRARKRCRKNAGSYPDYTLEQSLVDIQRYDQETCNLNVGLNELARRSLAGPEGSYSNQPILPLPRTPLANSTPSSGISSPAPPVSLFPDGPGNVHQTAGLPGGPGSKWGDHRDRRPRSSIRV